MAADGRSIGIVGGSGMLGGAIARALLERGGVRDERLWISNRTGTPLGFEACAGLHATADNQQLADACDVVVLSVPPAAVDNIGIRAPDHLLISVMAGVTIAEVSALTGAQRVVRAMSSPAAALGLAYSPWVAGSDVTAEDRALVRAIFTACGATDEVSDETQLDHFTAMTGPVPGFVAYFAKCMVDYALANGIQPEIADRAIRQLFLAAGEVMAHGEETPGEQVRAMIDYAGTTAAGLRAMEASPLSESISKGLHAATEKARNMR